MLQNDTDPSLAFLYEDWKSMGQYDDPHIAIPDDERDRLNMLPLTSPDTIKTINLPTGQYFSQGSVNVPEFAVPATDVGTNIPPKVASPASHDYLISGNSKSSSMFDGIGVIGGLALAAGAAILLATIG